MYSLSTPTYRLRLYHRHWSRLIWRHGVGIWVKTPRSIQRHQRLNVTPVCIKINNASRRHTKLLRTFPAPPLNVVSLWGGISITGNQR